MSKAVALRCAVIFGAVILAVGMSASPAELSVGIAGHAFDHLGGIADQAEVAARSGANIIYVTGVGGLGYGGLPAENELRQQQRAAAVYLANAKRNGIRLAIGYVCATSIVNLGQFDRNWAGPLRQQFRTPPAEWRQKNREGKPLPSWYGGDYSPACMNNPDWRAYEHFIVRLQLEAGCDGIFFDNPTVHPEGCYCDWCMDKFRKFLIERSAVSSAEFRAQPNSPAACRAIAVTNREAFLRFRCTIARDFLEDMRRFARSIKPDVLVTANNSLNSADVLFSQCRSYAYNIYEMSQAEDFVVVEDMSSQPRTLTNGVSIEYGPTYQQLHAIAHSRPVVAVTLAEADYHTAPHLMRLAMAEAAANGASYLSWPTWPENERERMIALVRPEADFLRRNADLMSRGEPRQDVVLFLPFRNWLETNRCAASRIAADLSRDNIPYGVICEDDLPTFSEKNGPAKWRRTRVLVTESEKVFLPRERILLGKFLKRGGVLVSTDEPGWLEQIREHESSITVEGPATVRVRVFDEPHRTVVHLLNLNVQRISSFEDSVMPAQNLRFNLRVPFNKVRTVRAFTADSDGTSGPLKFSRLAFAGTRIEIELPRLELAALVIVE